MGKFITYFILFFALSSSTQNVVAGQALPVSKMQNVTSGVIQDKMNKRGFAANDPRYGATLDTASNGLAAAAGTAAGVAVAGALTAPAWLTVAIAAGIGVVVTYAVAVGIDVAKEWLFSDDPNNQTPISTAGEQSPAFAMGDEYWYSSQVGVHAGSGSAAVQADIQIRNQGRTLRQFETTNCYSLSETTFGCDVIDRDTVTDATFASFATYAYKSPTSPNACPTGQVYFNGSCMPEPTPKGEVLTATQAVNQLSPVQLAQPVNPEIVAAVADKAWRDAASQPDYDGVPYSPNDPIRKEDVETWKQSNPDDYPTVADFVNPQSTEQPWKLPNSSTPVQTQPSTQTETSINPASDQPQVNLGDDPVIGSPELEPTPTAQDILQPILDLFPSLKNYSPSMSSGTCPQETLHLFGETQTMNAHCQLLEENKSAIQQAMVLFYSLLALFIILSA